MEGSYAVAHTASQSNCQRQNPELKTPLAVFSLLELELHQEPSQCAGLTLSHTVDVLSVTCQKPC